MGQEIKGRGGRGLRGGRKGEGRGGEGRGGEGRGGEGRGGEEMGREQFSYSEQRREDYNICRLIVTLESISIITVDFP